MQFKNRLSKIEPLEPRRMLSAVPAPAHVVVVVEENYGYSSIIGSSSAPYINSLAQNGALFTQSYATTHPSQPNYLAMFSGSDQGVTDDEGPLTFNGPNLASTLTAAGRSFVGYSEDLPAAGSTVLTSGAYARKHNPWSDFTNVPASANQPLTAFPTDYNQLPTVSFVVPNLNNDMHDGSIQQGDAWVQSKLGAYATWAKTHNSLLVVTFDEDDGSQNNRIATVFYGQQVRNGSYAETINHYNLLRTIEDMFGTQRVGASATAAPITDAWQAPVAAGVVNGTAAANVFTLTQDADHLHVNWSSDSANGQVSINDAAGLTINGNGANDAVYLNYANGTPLPNKLSLNGTFTVTGLQGTNPLAGRSLNINQSSVYINYANASDPLALIKGYIRNGYNGGAWDGAPTASTGVITSSAAQADASHATAVGYADAADGTGVNAKANTVLLRYTVAGDINLDGTVSLADYTTVVRNFGKPADWTGGAVSYTNAVTLADYTAVVRRYSLSAAASPAVQAASTDPALVPSLAAQSSTDAPTVGTATTSDAAPRHRRSRR